MRGGPCVIIDPEYDMIVAAYAGETVWDMFTRRNVRVIRVDSDELGNVGYWLDTDAEDMARTGGGRFPWEIFPPHQGENV